MTCLGKVRHRGAGQLRSDLCPMQKAMNRIFSTHLGRISTLFLAVFLGLGKLFLKCGLFSVAANDLEREDRVCNPAGCVLWCDAGAVGRRSACSAWSGNLKKSLNL